MLDPTETSLDADPGGEVALERARPNLSGATDRVAWSATRRAMERRPMRSTPDGPRRQTTTPEIVKVGIRLGLKLTGLWRRGLANGLDIRRRTVALRLPGLPAGFDGYRILQISDLHLDLAPGLGEAIVRAVAGREVDLCVLTGDFRATDSGPFTETEILAPLAAIRQAVRAADGCLAILGNHDAADMVAPFEHLGLHVLINETHRLRRGGHEIAITGIDDVHRYYTAAVAAAVEVLAADSFGVLLAHSPELAGEAAGAGYGLYLCGHCHGGQICLPGGRPLVKHLTRHHDLYAGLWQHGQMWGYTSTGAGMSTVPVRFNCPAEVTEFHLHAAT